MRAPNASALRSSEQLHKTWPASWARTYLNSSSVKRSTRVALIIVWCCRKNVVAVFVQLARLNFLASCHHSCSETTEIFQLSGRVEKLLAIAETLEIVSGDCPKHGTANSSKSRSLLMPQSWLFTFRASIQKL